MKSSLLKNSGIVLIAAATLGACNPLNKMAKNADAVKYSVDPNPLEMHGDSVALTISGKYPPQFFPKKVTMEVTPVLKEAGENGAVIMEFKPVNLVGVDADGEGKKIDYDKGGSFNYTDKVAYKKAMQDAVLEVKAVASFKTKSKEIGQLEIGKGTVVTPNLVESDEKPIMAKDKFVKILPRENQATINYLINSSVVRRTELNDEDYEGMIEFLKTGVEKEYAFKSIKIEAYASPDGEISLNENLADDRAESAKKAVIRELKRQKVEFNEDELFSLMPKGEDWKGFQQAMKASDIKDKDLILRILNMYEDVNRREKEIKNLAATYTEVAEKILPDLRRSKIMIDAEESARTDEEILALLKSNPDTLSIEEMLYGATLIEDLDEKLAVYTKASEVYPDDYRGFNNAGYILMVQNKKSQAKAQFNKAAEVAPDAPIVNNNLGIVARQEGKIDEAMELYDKAANAGPEVKYNRGIVNIIQGDYEMAKRNFGGENDFNKALALVLLNEEDAGLNALNASEEKESAKAYYLKAIIGARTDKKDMMVNNLKTAIKMDSALRTRAQKDAEFLDYREDAEFKALF